MTASLLETHVSTLFFVDGLVYKRKKPLDLGFCDFRSRTARLANAQDEVRLNRRLSPDVYLGIADVLGTDGQPCDHLVVLRELPADRRLATLVQQGADVDDVLTQVADGLAALHRASPARPELHELGSADWWRHLWTVGLDALVPFTATVPAELREHTRSLAMRWLAGRTALLDARVAAGRLHDGHGDLLADDIFALPDGPRILDCLEFDERLRVCDGLADAAFLAMDLERLGTPAGARSFLDAYERAAADDPPAALEDFYLAYRAHIRSKVAALRAGQSGRPEDGRQARELAGLALAHLDRARVRLVLVGGLPGSGKSTLASGLAAGTGWLLLSSDRTRKRLAGISPETPAPAAWRAGVYRTELTIETYTALLDEARTALAHGRSVVIDASFTDVAFRVQARELARQSVADLVEVVATVAPDVADERIRRRGATPSDATPAVRARLADVAHPWPEGTLLRTDRTPEETLDTLLGLVGAAPRGADGIRLLPSRAPVVPVGVATARTGTA